MKPIRWPACVGLVLAASALAQDTRPNPVRKKLLETFEAVLGPTLGASMTTRVIEGMDLSLRKGNDVTLLLDGAFTRSGKPLYVTTWAEEVFTFPLTPDQAKAAGLYRDGVVVEEYPPAGLTARVEKPVILLSDVKIEGGPAVAGDAPVKGAVSYRCDRARKNVAITLRAAYRVNKSALSFQNVPELQETGTLSFSFSAINDAKGDVTFGPMVIFLEVLLGGSGGGFIASNTLATLVDVRPDLDAFARLGISIFDDVTRILSSVNDQASAAKALDDYKKLAVRMKAMLKDMERLTPTKEQNDEIERKHGDTMTAAGNRMKAEIDRIERTEWGRAFLKAVEAVAPK